MVSIEIIAGYFITGIIWGSTNAFMEVGSKDEAPESQQEDQKDNDSN